MPTSRSSTKPTTQSTRNKSKSPAKSKSPSRKKSPTRTKNVTTSTIRTVRTRKVDDHIKLSPPPSSSTPKSPTRRSPGRRSPIRTSKLKQDIDKFYKETRTWTVRKSADPDSDSDAAEIKEVKEKPQATVRARTRIIDDDYRVSETRESLMKELDRRSRSHDIERIVHLRHYDTVTKRLGEFSDEDDPIRVRRSQSVDVNNEKTTEFGGALGAFFLMFLTITSLLYLFIMCNEKQCTFTQLPNLQKYQEFSTYFNAIAFLGVIIFLSLIALLSVLPIGGRRVYGLPNKQGRLVYIMNGMFSMIMVMGLAIGLEVYGVGLFRFIVEHLFHILIASMVIGFVLSIYVYLRSFYVPLISLNTHVINKNPIYGFFMGRELNPRIFNLLDMKMFVLRCSLIGTILLDFAYLYEDTTKNGGGYFDIESLNLNFTLLLLVLLHTIYLIHPLIYEETWVTTFEVQYEGFGFMGAFGYLIYPLMMVSIVKYLIDYQIKLVYWKLILIGCQFLIGFILYRGSNKQKDAFRKNPYSPALSHLETIPTGHGKKLICSSYWGIVRHPNYLGDILMNLSFAWFAPFVLPSVPFYSIVLLLIHRALRDHYRCKQKYGSSWTRYCNRVKYMLIPKVF